MKVRPPPCCPALLCILTLHASNAMHLQDDMCQLSQEGDTRGGTIVSTFSHGLNLPLQSSCHDDGRTSRLVKGDTGSYFKVYFWNHKTSPTLDQACWNCQTCFGSLRLNWWAHHWALTIVRRLLWMCF